MPEILFVDVVAGVIVSGAVVYAAGADMVERIKSNNSNHLGDKFALSVEQKLLSTDNSVNVSSDPDKEK